MNKIHKYGYHCWAIRMFLKDITSYIDRKGNAIYSKNNIIKKTTNDITAITCKCCIKELKLNQNG
jgi:hypothetical protein